VPHWPLAEALDRIVAWQRAWLANDDMHAYCIAEVERFVGAHPAHAA
jgi:CDP-glucose 4,6-dehydratase